MSKEGCILPCNGLDKCAGDLSRQAALKLTASGERSLICPVLLNQNQSPYEKILAKGDLTVIDGCNTRCASKLAGELGLGVRSKINVSEVAKGLDIKLGVDIHEDEDTRAVVLAVVDKVTTGSDEGAVSEFIASTAVDYTSFSHDKFVFSVPTSGYYFNENDCWVRLSGNMARIGVSDYVQQNLSDILYVEPPEIGAEFEQFDDLGSLESSKSVFEIVAPVAGTVIAVNTALSEAPERVNEDPYEEGWLVEVRLRDFSEDQELLHDCPSYFDYLMKKVEADD
jgi:glycine cleavage system H protein